MSESTHPIDVFPDRLRLAREKRDLNQAKLGKRAGLQVSAISHFETGTRKPSFDNLRRLADALDVTTDFLLGRVHNFGDMAGVDQLNRDGKNLSSDDIDLAKKFMQLLEERNKGRQG